MIAFIERHRAKLCWQPIETAPMDGTEILTCFEMYRRILHYSDVYNSWFDEFANEYEPPTYWMPLPEPVK